MEAEPGTLCVDELVHTRLVLDTLMLLLDTDVVKLYDPLMTLPLVELEEKKRSKDQPLALTGFISIRIVTAARPRGWRSTKEQVVHGKQQTTTLMTSMAISAPSRANKHEISLSIK